MTLRRLAGAVLFLAGAALGSATGSQPLKTLPFGWWCFTLFAACLIAGIGAAMWRAGRSAHTPRPNVSTQAEKLAMDALSELQRAERFSPGQHHAIKDAQRVLEDMTLVLGAQRIAELRARVAAQLDRAD